MLEKIHNSWNPILSELYQEPLNTLKKILPTITYLPNREKVFRVFEKPLKDIKVVILGQDPYPIIGDAVGLSFVNGNLNKIPFSLKVIYTELEKEGFSNPNIHTWEEQGVFLLNTALTVEMGKAGSHLEYWKPFINKVIRYISYHQPCIWLLWGNKAQEFKKSIYNQYIFTDNNVPLIKDLPMAGKYNFILEAPHPVVECYNNRSSFYGCNHFKKVNMILEKSKQKIIW